MRLKKNLVNNSSLQKLDSSLFVWQAWRSGSPNDLNLTCRYNSLTSKRGSAILKEYAIGWCYAENLMCRPKLDNRAVMFFKDNNLFWFHMRNEEFMKVFGEV